MNCIKEYIKDGKKLFKVCNMYLGVNPYTGKEVRKSKKNFKSRKEANIFISQMQLKFENGELFESNKNYTFQQVFNLWLDTYKRTVKESSYYKRLDNSKKVLATFGTRDIKRITRLDCQRFVNGLADKGYSLNYINGNLSTLKLVMRFALNNDLIKNNVSTGLLMPKIEKEKEYKFYSKDELTKFLTIVEKNYDLQIYLTFRLLAYTGARISEILALTWNDIDFNESKININKTLASGKNNALIVQTPKTKSSARIIGIDPDTTKILRHYKLQQAENFLKVGRKNNNIVFTALNKNTYTRRENITAINSKICNKHNFKKINLHGFRHTHCSLLFESGATIQVVQDRLGHSNIKTTMDIYNHVTEKQKENTADNFAEYLKKVE